MNNLYLAIGALTKIEQQVFNLLMQENENTIISMHNELCIETGRDDIVIHPTFDLIELAEDLENKGVDWVEIRDSLFSSVSKYFTYDGTRMIVFPFRTIYDPNSPISLAAMAKYMVRNNNYLGNGAIPLLIGAK